MPDLPIVTAAIAFVVSNASSWLSALQGTLLNCGGEIALQKGTHLVRSKLHLDEKEQLHHLKAALKQAVEAGETRFQTPAEKAQYRAILANLSEPGEHSDRLRREALRLFTLSEIPHLAELNTLYNRSLQVHTQEQSIPSAEVDSVPYLSAFFDALIAALYADPLFKQQMSDVLHLRFEQNMQRSLIEVSSTLRQIDDTLANHYTTEEFERDRTTYTAYMERTLHYLKLVGVVPKDRGSEHVDPELSAIFVPLRLAPEDTKTRDSMMPISIIGWLERFPNLVLLGGPGSGKSTATRYLSWSHAAVHLNPPLISPSSVPLLSGKPLPLRIELRRLSEERRQQPNLDFLDYAVHVLLGRAGSHIKRQMFVELLTQKQMLCLFDGLDEVGTLDERRRLIDEIEEFAQRYPGNRVLVTSRPVGYDLARFSNQLFTHTRVEDFDNQQIGEFLERWYTHVLRLSPLPPDDRQELETLYTTLKENPRLHVLASNPLLLTVITALHRYERLPDRRILVYDRCADLLLDTWAKLKGTNVRWKDMKLGKEDQYACVAHLGFVLHERSQEKKGKSTGSANNPSTTSAASDVPTRFMLKEIEHFLSGRRLLSETAEQRAEAKRFLDLMQIEAGLIVERGKGEDGEDLYGFVHRTFQEYFAATDVYERYQQEEDPTIISAFLHEHLYDPHWYEVTLLLLAKLKRRPATLQLRQVLERESRLGRHVDILHQNLFFVCACLAEDIPVDIELAKSVVERISYLVEHAPFPSQRIKALDALTSLMRTRQYAHLGQEKIRLFATQDVLSDPLTKAHAVQLFYKSCTHESQEQREVTQRLVEVMQREDLTVEQCIKAAEALRRSSPFRSYEQRQASKKLVEIMQRSDLTINQTIKVAQALYWSSPYGSQERQTASQKLMELIHHPDLTIDQTIKVAQALYRPSSSGSQEHQTAVQKLIELMHHPDLTIDQAIKVAQALYQSSSSGSQEHQIAVQKLIELMHHPDLTIDQAIKVAQTLYWHSPSRSQEYQTASQKLMELIHHPDLTIDQAIKVAQTLYWHSPSRSQEYQTASQKLIELIHHPDLTIDQAIKVAQALYWHSPSGSQELQAMIQKLMELMHHPDLTIEQTIKAADILYTRSLYQSPEEQQAIQKLLEVMQRGDLTIEDNIKAAEALYRSSPQESQGQRQAMQSLSEFMLHSNLPSETVIQVAQELRKVPIFRSLHFPKSQQYQQILLKLREMTLQEHLSIDQRIEVITSFYIYSTFSWYYSLEAHELLIKLLESINKSVDYTIKIIQAYNELGYFARQELDAMVEKVLELVQLSDISLEQSMEAAQLLSQLLSRPPFMGEKQLVIEKLVNLMQCSSLSIEQNIRIAQALYISSPIQSKKRQLATEKLAELVKRMDLTAEQSIDAAQALYNSSLDESQEQQQATQKLVKLVECTDLSIEQHIRAVQALYRSSRLRSPERQQAAQKLWQLTSDQDLCLDQRLQSALVPLTVQDANYADRVQSLRIAFSLTDEEVVIRQIKKRWRSIGGNSKAQAADIPYLVNLVKDERLPIEVRDEVYNVLESMIPEFDDIVYIDD